MSLVLVLLLIAVLVSAVCLVLSLLRVPYSVPGWVIWAILLLLCLILYLGMR